MQLSVSNEKLTYSAIYGVFAPWTAQCRGILNLQRNSDCNLCLSPLLSPFSFRLKFLLVRIMCKSSFRNSKSDWTDSFSKWIIRAFQSDLEFRKLDLHMILTSRNLRRNEKGDKSGDRHRLQSEFLCKFRIPRHWAVQGAKTP